MVHEPDIRSCDIESGDNCGYAGYAGIREARGCAILGWHVTSTLTGGVKMAMMTDAEKKAWKEYEYFMMDEMARHNKALKIALWKLTKALNMQLKVDS